MNGLRQDHLSLIAKNHARFGIRSGTGLIFAIFTLLAGLILGSVLVDPVSQLIKAQSAGSGADLDQVILAVNNEVGRPILKWATDGTSGDLTFWLQDKPALVSAFLIFFLLLVPFLACLGSFNQLSGDIGSRGIRYLLLRTERGNLFFGRFLGTLVFCAVVYFALFVIMALFFAFKLNLYSFGDVSIWMARGFLMTIIYSLPWIALAAWISASIDSPFGSLAMTYLFAGGIPLLILILGKVQEKADALRFITPVAYRNWLYSSSTGATLAGTGVMLAFTGFFLFMGARHFERRDL